ncbi:serine/threonine-protein kinase 31 isoform X2 [Magallana gigas]|uniref:serine/threonine-protein kinase 31 isoform X2 n=1 Tax=Magallana gigas TaxID=29159 RepID=UPI00333E2950
MAKKMQTYDVFVGNLPLDADEKLVGKLFSKFGETKSMVVKDANSTPKKRFAFVNFMCEPDAEQAIKEMNGFQFNSTRLVVRRQEPRKKGPIKREFDSDRDTNPVNFGGWNSPGEVIKDDVLTPFLYSTGMKEIVMVTYVENPVTAWVQTVTEENTAQLTSIMEQLTQCCPAAPKVKGTPQIGKVYAAMFSEDGEWYRCVVKQLFGSETLKVQYIDYGNTEEIQATGLLEIPPTVAAHKPLAYKLVLHNIMVKDVTDQNGIRFLRKLTESRHLLAYKTRQLNDATGYYGYLSIEGDPVNINEKVVMEGFASKRPSLGARGGGDRGDTFNPSTSNHVPGHSNSLGSGDHASMFGSNSSLNNYMTNESGYGQRNRSSINGAVPGHQGVQKPQYPGRSPQRNINMPPAFNIPPPLMGARYPSPTKGTENFYHTNSGESISSQQRAEEVAQHLEIQKTLQNDISKKKREIDKLRTDMARKELELQQASANKVQVHSVVELAKKVKRLRLQFPTGRASGLDEAIELALSEDRVTNSSVTTLQHVITAVSTYRALQKEICNAKDVEELDSLVETRDLARKNLYDKLTECVQELEVMPLDIRHQCVSEAEEKVSKNYKAFTHISVHGCPSLEDLLHGFRDWKKKKETEFSHVRENTNICQREVTKALLQLEKVLNLDSEDSEENANLEINSLLKTYMQALQQEISITDMEQCQDASLVATVLTAILNELHGEIGVLDNCRQFMAEFTQMKAGIQPWLDNKPKFEDIQECRKMIRALKSKLRHKEADRQDLEESGDTEEEKAVKREIQELQYQLHQALVSHDELVLDIAKVADSHFPELLIKHQDTGIRTYLDYNGIVRSGWEIEHFALTPAVRPGMYASTFCGNPVYIQEYHVGDSEHLWKEDFLAQVMAYCSICSDSDSLSTVQAVFFTKNDRIGYVILNVEPIQDLESFMNEPGFDDTRRQKIARGVTCGLSLLHQQGFVHGEVNPQNVGVKADGSGVLLCPDFSRSLFDRTKRGFMTSHGMMFQAPEVMNVHQSAPVQITAKTDLYLLGLLILYLHHPRSVIPAARDGTPNLAVLSLDTETGSLLYNLLCGKPDMRLAAAHLLKSGYLTRTIKDVSVATTLEKSFEQQETSDPVEEVANAAVSPTEVTTTQETRQSVELAEGSIEEDQVLSMMEPCQGTSTPPSNIFVSGQELAEVEIVSQVQSQNASASTPPIQVEVEAQPAAGSDEKSPELNAGPVDEISPKLDLNGTDDLIKQSVLNDSVGSPEHSIQEFEQGGLVQEISIPSAGQGQCVVSSGVIVTDSKGLPLNQDSEMLATDHSETHIISINTESRITPDKFAPVHSPSVPTNTETRMTPDKFATVHSPSVPTHTETRMTPDKFATVHSPSVPTHTETRMTPDKFAPVHSLSGPTHTETRMTPDKFAPVHSLSGPTHTEARMTPDKFAPVHSPIVPTHMDGRMTPDKFASNVDRLVKSLAAMKAKGQAAKSTPEKNQP